MLKIQNYWAICHDLTEQISITHPEPDCPAYSSRFQPASQGERAGAGCQVGRGLGKNDDTFKRTASRGIG
jgi:hypothetical protein